MYLYIYYFVFVILAYVVVRNEQYCAGDYASISTPQVLPC